jgi:hypothetical protein
VIFCGIDEKLGKGREREERGIVRLKANQNHTALHSSPS